MTAELDLARPRAWRVHQQRWTRLWRRPPLLIHLMGFALIVLTPALLFSAFLVFQFSEQQKSIAAGQVADTAEIISDAIDREIYAMITSAKVLASSPFLDEAETDIFDDRAQAALEATGSSAILVDPALRVVVDTKRPGAAGTALDHRETVEAAFATRRTQISGAFLGPDADTFVFHVAVPVFRGDRVLFVLAISRETSELTPILTARNIPETWSAIIRDGQGSKVTAVLATNGQMRRSSSNVVDSPSLAESLGEGMNRDFIEASYTSALSSWTTTVAVPNAVIGQPIKRSWLLLVGMGVALLSFSALLAIVFGRRLAAPILKLADQAKAIGRGEPALPVHTVIEEVGGVSKVLAQASRDRRDAEEQNSFLMREMSHRAKNQYALIGAIARRAAKESSSTNEFLATLSEALASLARSADLLAGKGWDSAGMADLAATQLQAFGVGPGHQIGVAGPPVRLNPSAAQTIGLALHELATNAAKYGALSVPGGSVEIRWKLDETFRLSWREIDGPPVVEPKRSGFGTLVTQKMTARGLGGEVDMRYAPSGVTWQLIAPRDAVLAT
ncbi:hypothetical protein ASG43_13165 [Aureimonas sp. Leaf454]|uniref:sensor histidine kinase n=1 Tax=Aureimonas sp. Leaf454 TaxID=1736381 RepID=UPI0006F21E27|nr:sensor histidine kinase [Aureimonas sp. Leaf454]KQT45229.1 hypothetical protein ASG43_13165 [Aureimonas sp. Leaf454]